MDHSKPKQGKIALIEIRNIEMAMRSAIAVAMLVLLVAATSAMAGGAQGPSVRAMMANKAVVDAMKKAWQDSFATRPSQMRGGWIYANPNNNADMVAVMAAKDRYTNDEINLDSPNMPADRNYVLVGDFHTHPFPSGQRDRADSEDVKRAFNRGVPGMVVSCSGLYYYGPASRASMDGPSTYPNTSPAASYNGQQDVKLSNNVLDSNPSLCSST